MVCEIVKKLTSKINRRMEHMDSIKFCYDILRSTNV